jgi:hypothetical protein
MIVDLLTLPEEPARLAGEFLEYVRSNLTGVHPYEKYPVLPGHDFTQ